MPGNPLLRHDAAGLCTLTLNRPDKLNALDTPLFERLDAEIALLEQQTVDIGCIVLRGAGRAFCAGADLQALGTVPVPPAFKPGVVDRLARLPQPVIAAVHGVCFTGGLELALACDFIVADSTARFADTHATWGLVGAWGITQRLPRRVGAAVAKRLMMTARPIDASTALQLGLVDLLAPEGGLDALLAGFTADILAGSWHTHAANKRLLRETDGMDLARGLQHAASHYPGPAPDAAQRIARFAARNRRDDPAG